MRCSLIPLKKLERELIPIDSMNMPMAVLRVINQATTNMNATMYSEKGTMIHPWPIKAYGS